MADTQIKNCKQCDAEFAAPIGVGGMPRRYCSVKCRYTWNDRRKGKRERQPKPLPPPLWVGECVHCKSEMTGQKRKFCGSECRSVYYREVRPRLMGVLPWDERKALERASARRADCAHCGKNFHAKASKKGQPQKFCSNKCKWEAKRKYASKREAREAWRRAQGIKPREIKLPSAPVEKACRDCGDVVAKWAQRCEPCRLKAKSARKQKAKHSPSVRVSRAASKASYKIRLRQATVERFDPFDVFERDGWRCHMCGIKTPKRLRGTYEDNAPELDHIVPLAAGGDHSRRNTACSCRKCNIAKSDKPLGQLRLVA
jgi:hypothetical protein